MAWNQGIDLYGYANNRILAFAEHTAKGNLLVPGSNNTYYTVPYIPMNVDAWPTEYWESVFANGSIGAGRPTWGCIYHHYVNVKGLAAPFTGKMIGLQTPEGGGGNYGSTTGGYDQLGYETLTCSLPNHIRKPTKWIKLVFSSRKRLDLVVGNSQRDVL